MPDRKLIVARLLLAAVVFRAGAQASPLWVQAGIQGADMMMAYSNTTPGKWYQAQWTSSLVPPGGTNWQPVGSPARQATNASMTLVLSNDNAAPQRFYRVRQLDSPPAGRNLAPAAAPLTSYVSSWETLSAINDGYVPANSSDHSHGAYGNWPQTGTQWVEYDWPLPVSTELIDVLLVAGQPGHLCAGLVQRAVLEREQFCARQQSIRPGRGFKSIQHHDL